MTTWEAKMKQLINATARLEESLQERGTEKDRNSSILLFIITYDVAWKVLKSHLGNNLGVHCASPKTCFREAYVQSVIKYEKQWLEMVDDRNDITHLYQESVAEDLYEELPQYLKLFQDLLQRLQKED